MSKGKLDAIRESLEKIRKWPDPSPEAGRGGPGHLWTAGILFQYQHDREKHESEIAEILRMLDE